MSIFNEKGQLKDYSIQLTKDSYSEMDSHDQFRIVSPIRSYKFKDLDKNQAFKSGDWVALINKTIQNMPSQDDDKYPAKPKNVFKL